MAFRSIGSLLPGVLEKAARVARFQEELNAMPTPADQKRAIIDAHCAGTLDHDETTMLIEIYQLERA